MKRELIGKLLRQFRGGVEPVNEPIQIVEGALSCPKCAGELKHLGGVAVAPDGDLLIPLECHSKCGTFGLEISSCPEEHTHIRWVQLPKEPDPSLN